MLFQQRIPLIQDDAPTVNNAYLLRYLSERRGYKQAFYEQLAACHQQGTLLEVSGGWSFAGIDILRQTSCLSMMTIAPDLQSCHWRWQIAKMENLGEREEIVIAADNGLPFPSACFAGVVSVNRLHRWCAPSAVLRELYRVLEPGGYLWINDLRRDADEWIAEYQIRELQRDRRPYGAFAFDRFVRAWRASYTAEELETLLEKTGLSGYARYEDDGAMARTLVITKAM